MNAEFVARAHIYAEQLRDLELKLAKLTDLTDDQPCLASLGSCVEDVNRAQMKAQFVAQRAAAFLREQDRQQILLRDQLERSVEQRRCQEVGGGR